VRLFSPIHISLLAATATVAIVLAVLCRRDLLPARAVRLTLGWGLALNEIVWLIFHYSHKGMFAQKSSAPTLRSNGLVDRSGMPHTASVRRGICIPRWNGVRGLTLLTPDLYSPWPSYPAIYFFLGHGGIVIARCDTGVWTDRVPSARRGVARLRVAAPLCRADRNGQQNFSCQLHVLVSHAYGPDINGPDGRSRHCWL
jgi:hypothetical protein